MNRHGTALEWQSKGFLLTGPPGCGKSGLALQLIERGAVLVADDQVLLDQQDGTWTATCPEALSGQLHLRGTGLLQVKTKPATHLAVIFQSVQPAASLSRSPELGLPVITVDFIAPDAAALIETALQRFDSGPPFP